VTAAALLLLVISIDRLGADVRIRSGGEYSVERLGFHQPVESLADIQEDLDRRLIS
jgi:hypothetical protein